MINYLCPVAQSSMTSNLFPANYKTSTLFSKNQYGHLIAEVDISFL